MPETRPAPPPVRSPAQAPAARPAYPRPIFATPSVPVSEPRFGAALLAGAAAAVVGAAVWAAITFATDFQIGWMAVAVGAGVGVSVRRAGRGVDPRFGIAAAGLALVGCVAGNLLATSAYLASFTHVSFFHVLASLDAATATELMKATFSPMDLLFYGIAMMEAFKLALPKKSGRGATSR